MDVRARALAAFQAFAIGDALGMPTQLLEHERASDLLACDWFEPGPQDSEVCPGLPAATITDDTWQLLMLADNLIAGDGQFEALKFAEQMLDWESSMIRAGSKDLLGPSTKRALDHLRKTGNPSRVSISGTTNGASMRAPAIGLLNSIAQEGSERLLVDKVVAVNRVSHNSNEANVASVAVAAIISAGIDGNPLSKATERGLAAARLAAGYFCEAPQPERLVDKIEKALGSNQLDDLSAAKFFVEEIGVSLESIESIPTAIAIANRFADDSFAAALFAAKLGGDSDTIAALAAAMVAACGASDFGPASPMAIGQQQRSLPACAIPGWWRPW